MDRLRIPAVVGVLLWTTSGLAVLGYTWKAILATADGDGSYLDKSPAGGAPPTVSDAQDATDAAVAVGIASEAAKKASNISAKAAARERNESMRQAAATYYSELAAGGRPTSPAMSSGKFKPSVGW